MRSGKSWLSAVRVVIAVRWRHPIDRFLLWLTSVMVPAPAPSFGGLGLYIIIGLCRRGEQNSGPRPKDFGHVRALHLWSPLWSFTQFPNRSARIAKSAKSTKRSPFMSPLGRDADVAPKFADKHEEVAEAHLRHPHRQRRRSNDPCSTKDARSGSSVE